MPVGETTAMVPPPPTQWPHCSAAVAEAMADPKDNAELHQGLVRGSLLKSSESIAFRAISEDPAGKKETKKKEAIQDPNVIIEPRTGFKFPSFLVPIWSAEGSNQSMQMCAGVGLRGVSLIKVPLLKIYAFGFYVNQEVLKLELGSKYKSIPPEELKSKNDFYEDLLRYELELSVRLIVHHKHVRISMVKSAFETSLKNRLQKIKGTNDSDDEALREFCSYFTNDLSLAAGTAIDFQWQPGGLFHTKVGDRFLGTIHSLDFCRAFFDLYVGDPPVCSKAKQEIGLNLGQMLIRP